MLPRIIPTIYIPLEEPNRTLSRVFLEQYKDFEILWYCWPRDGFFHVEDYEPIILVYDKEDLFSIATRRGWHYQISLADEIHRPVEIAFGGPLNGIFHHPFLHHQNYDDVFRAQTRNKVLQHYTVQASLPDQIPAMFRIGRGHPTSFGRTVSDPAILAQRISTGFYSI
jgi:hypothetical protein